MLRLYDWWTLAISNCYAQLCLELALREHFAEVELRVEGKLAPFAGRQPIR